MTHAAPAELAVSAGFDDVHPLLAGRSSPRSSDPAHEISDAQLQTLLEAARWAPSAYNSQPWRFVVGHRGNPTHARLVGLLVDSNRVWAPSASALVLVLAVTVDDAGASLSHALYDTGQAVTRLSLQAAALGLATHQIGGFDAALALRVVAAPATWAPVVLIAVGRQADAERLPPRLAERERAPRVRRPLSELLLLPPRS